MCLNLDWMSIKIWILQCDPVPIWTELVAADGKRGRRVGKQNFDRRDEKKRKKGIEVASIVWKGLWQGESSSAHALEETERDGMSLCKWVAHEKVSCVRTGIFFKIPASGTVRARKVDLNPVWARLHPS